jgi:hypothetical protein
LYLNNIAKEPIVAFHGNNKPFDIANNCVYIYAMNDKKGRYCYVSMAAMVTRTHHKITSVNCLPCYAVKQIQ